VVALRVKLLHARANGLCLLSPDTGSEGPHQPHGLRSASQSVCGEFGRVLFNARPIGATGALGCAGDDLVNHDGVERFMNHQGASDGQHHVAVLNAERLGLGEGLTAEAIGLLWFSFTSLKGWFDMRDLSAVLAHEEPLPIRHAIQCSGVAGSSARRRHASAQ
jgi:hypothetical protein